MWRGCPLVFQMKAFSLIVLDRGDCIQGTSNPNPDSSPDPNPRSNEGSIQAEGPRALKVRPEGKQDTQTNAEGVEPLHGCEPLP